MTEPNEPVRTASVMETNTDNRRRTPYVTKSRLMSGLRCPKRLWLQTFQQALAKPSATSQLTIDNGIEVGRMARLNYPQGRLVGHVEQPERAVAETKELLEHQPASPLFEAAFVHAGTLVRADILAPDGDAWRMVEVKSSGSVKDHHLLDCAIQLWVVEGAGVPISTVSIAHVDTSFVYAGDGDYAGLLVEEDVTEQVRALLEDVPDWLKNHRHTLANGEPDIRIGAQCKPECPFMSYCERVRITEQTIECACLSLPAYPLMHQ